MSKMLLPLYNNQVVNIY